MRLRRFDHRSVRQSRTTPISISLATSYRSPWLPQLAFSSTPSYLQPMLAKRCGACSIITAISMELTSLTSLAPTSSPIGSRIRMVPNRHLILSQGGDLYVQYGGCVKLLANGCREGCKSYLNLGYELQRATGYEPPGATVTRAVESSTTQLAKQTEKTASSGRLLVLQNYFLTTKAE